MNNNHYSFYLPGSVVDHIYHHHHDNNNEFLSLSSDDDDNSSSGGIIDEKVFHPYHHQHHDSFEGQSTIPIIMDENTLLRINGLGQEEEEEEFEDEEEDTHAHHHKTDTTATTASSSPPQSQSQPQPTNDYHVGGGWFSGTTNQNTSATTSSYQPIHHPNSSFQSSQQFNMNNHQQHHQVKQKIKKAILYIDLDNFPISRPSVYLDMLSKIKSKYFIDVTAKKIFGDLNQFEKLPVDFQFSHQLIICPKVSSRKNTTDIALTIEVIKDLERKKPFDVFIIASSDSDFVPVVKAIRDEGKECWILPSHNYPHQTLMSICNGILDFNSHQAVSNPLQDLNLPSKPNYSTATTNANTTTTNTTSPTSPSSTAKEVTTHHIKTNDVPPSQKKPSIPEVKLMMTKIVKKLAYSGVKTFNLSFVHEQLREKSILYHHYGYPTFKSLFEEWRLENPKIKLTTNEKDGQLSFCQEVHPTILHRPIPATATLVHSSSLPPPPISSISAALDMINNTINANVKEKNSISNSSSSSNLSQNNSSELVKQPRRGRSKLKKAITQILKDLFEKNPKGSFNMSCVNERMVERGLRYKEHGYESMKILFKEWKEEHPTATLGVLPRSGELFFLPTFSL